MTGIWSFGLSRALMPRVMVWVGIAGATMQGAEADAQPWILQFGTSSGDEARAAASDGAGGVFLTGETAGALGGVSVGLLDAWIARYDSKGERSWIRQFGSAQMDGPQAAASDGVGSVFVSGTTWGDLGGPNAGLSDCWLAQFDSSGKQVWIRQFGTNMSEDVRALAADGAGVFAAGVAYGSMAAPQAGAGDAWVAMFDGLGNQTWTRQFGTTFADQARALAAHPSGGVFVAGHTGGTLGGPNAGILDAWLIRMDETGNQLWARQWGTEGFDEATAMVSDGAGGVFVTGWTEGDLGGHHWGNNDIWIARYDEQGNRVWIRQFATNETEFSSSLTSDGVGGVFVSGRTRGGLYGAVNAGSWDAWLAHFSGGGGRRWIHQFGTGGMDSSTTLAADGAGGVFSAGVTHGELAGSNAGGADAFLGHFPAFCYPDCNGDDSINLADFGCFQTRFALCDPYVDCNRDGVSNLADFGCFQAAFALGCP